jgi:hypothetical protein
VAERAGRVLLATGIENERLFASMNSLSGIVAEPSDVDDALYASIWSLPSLFATTRETIPSRIPYLAPPARGPELRYDGRPRVGLAWAGHPKTLINPDRSVPSMELLRPLVEMREVDWVSLQVGFRAAEAASLPFAEVPVIRDFGDTAYVLSQSIWSSQ